MTNKQNVITHYYKLYNGKCWMDERKLDKAVADGVMLEVHYHPTTNEEKVYTFDPKEWKATGERWDKVFRRPGDPMHLIGNPLEKAPLPPPKAPPKPKSRQETLF